MPETKPAALSQRLDLAHIGDVPHEIMIEADAAACAAIAADFGIPAIDTLRGRFRLLRGSDGRIEARLDLAAKVTQTCIVSLEPVTQTVAERASLILLTVADTAAATDDDSIDPDAPDEIIAEGTVVDLGPLLIEQLALALDPYPRRPGAEPMVASDDSEDGVTHPFAALAHLRRDR